MKVSRIHGPVIASATVITKIFGTKDSVCSFIWVAACKTDTIRPVMRIAKRAGAEINVAIQIALNPRSMTVCSLTSHPD